MDGLQFERLRQNVCKIFCPGFPYNEIGFAHACLDRPNNGKRMPRYAQSVKSVLMLASTSNRFFFNFQSDSKMFNFKIEPSLLDHVLAKERKILCDECGKSFAKKCYLQRHIRIQHLVNFVNNHFRLHSKFYISILI